MAFQKIATLDDVWSGEMIGLAIEGVPVVLVNVGGSLHGYADACPHLGTPLSLGSLKAGVLSCATHQWQFDAQTGCGLNPMSARLEPMPLKIEGNDILLNLEIVKETRKKDSENDA